MWNKEYMKLLDLPAIPGDTATFIKENGSYCVIMRCYGKNKWFREHMTGNWIVDENGMILEGELVLFNNREIPKC